MIGMNVKRTGKILVSAGAAVCLLVSISFGEIMLTSESENINAAIGGEAWVESGQFVKFYNQNIELNHTWINRTFMHLTMTVRYGGRIRITVGTEGRMWFNVPKQRGSGQATYIHRQNSTFIISDAYADYVFGNAEQPWLTVTAGLFPYKYNPQARNLGEYLFRSGTYPAYLINNFDLAFARLTGFKLSSDLFGMLHQDLIYSIETTIPPFFDGSVSYIAGCNFLGFGDIGAGISFANLVSVDERVTTPKNESNNAFNHPDYGSGYYTFRGIKLMGKGCVDIKRLIGLLLAVPDNLFGREDLKLYGEALILGLENYPRNDSINPISGSATDGMNPWGYDTLINKTLFVGGINLPAFHLLDVLAFELEWYGCTYPNSYEKRLGPGFRTGYPVPDFPAGGSDSENLGDYTKDNFKWSLYGKKMFFRDRLGFVLQFARDHIRNETLVDESFDYEEALRKPDTWWWMAKLVAQL
ncbi:MAG: hypothetical protein JXA71_10375 [Chitinispirillaceae bacterium]|nr:hypothetical protein [Chitinispirillaceae bacterium]